MPLVLVPDNASKPTVRLQQGVTEFGRSKTTKITDPWVSRKHVVFRVEGSNVFVLPVSTNQCMSLNGATLTPNLEVPMRIGDKLSLIADAIVYALAEQQLPPPTLKRTRTNEPEAATTADDDQAAGAKAKKGRVATDENNDGENQEANSTTEEAKAEPATIAPPDPKQEEEQKQMLENIEKDKKLFEGITEDLLCIICQEVFVYCHGLPCGHSFCRQCVTDWMERTPECPTCRSPANATSIFPVRAIDNTIQHMIDGGKLDDDSVEHYKERLEEEKVRPKVVHIADYAPGGRTKCHGCNTTIKKNDLRIGTNCMGSKFPEHYYHVNCVRQLTNRVRFEDVDLTRLAMDDHDVVRLVLEGQVR